MLFWQPYNRGHNTFCRIITRIYIIIIETNSRYTCINQFSIKYRFWFFLVYSYFLNTFCSIIIMSFELLSKIIGCKMDGRWIYNNLCNQCLSPLKLWVRTRFMTRCTRYNIIWYNLSVTYDRTVVFSGHSGFLHQ